MKHLDAKITVLSVLVLALVLAMAPARGGLGLGEARVESFLGQPLSTRISLLEPSEQALDTLSVEIASAEEHARLGVPVEALGLGLRIDVDHRADPPTLRLTSSRPINEPFVQILVSARWSGGRMLREYTLFLDPPTVPLAPPLRRVGESLAAPPLAVPRSVAPIIAAEPAPSPPAPAVADRAVEPAPRVADRAPDRPAPARSSVGPVLAGQTLWSIAAAWRPDDSVSMNQVMLAILERNPQAFADNNINRLMRGAELVMPDMAAVRAVPREEAQRKVREQNAAWRAEKDRMRATVPPSTAVVEPIRSLAQPEPVVTPEPEPEPEPVAAPEPEQAPAAQADAEAGVGEDSVPVAPESWTEADELALARLELTAADDALLTDSQALGAERERLEEWLGSLVQELSSDGLDTPAVDAEVDQIRQAIASNDAGGLMIASAGLAELEQQMREMRAQREAEAAAAEADAVVPVAAPELVADQPAIFRFAWLLGALLLALLLVLAVALVVFRRRRAAAQAVTAPAALAVSSVPSELREPDADPLDAGLAELYRLAEDEDHEAFGSALSAFHVQLDTTADPRWREAMTLARVLVPGHPLLRTNDDLESALAEGRESEGEAEPGLEVLLSDPDQGFADHSAAASDLEFEDEQDDAINRLLDQQDGEVEDVDIAKLANRLDPEEAEQQRPEVSASDEEELAHLFRSEPSSPPGWRLEAEDDGPLELDFDVFSRRESAAAEDAAEDAAKDSPPADNGQADVGPAPGGGKPSEELLESELLLDPDFDAPLSDQELLSSGHDWFELGDEPDDEVEPAAAEVARQDLDSVADREMPAGEERAAPLSDDDAEVKLDLARAYLSMDDVDSARVLLEEVIEEGSGSHRAQAQQLIEGLK